MPNLKNNVPNVDCNENDRFFKLRICIGINDSKKIIKKFLSMFYYRVNVMSIKMSIWLTFSIEKKPFFKQTSSLAPNTTQTL